MSTIEIFYFAKTTISFLNLLTEHIFIKRTLNSYRFILIMAEYCKCHEPHLDITIDENEIEKGAVEIIKAIRPSWPLDQLQFKLFTNGITNKLVGVWYPGHYNEMVLVRVYGHKTDLLINRKDETRNIRILYQAGYAHSLYATFNNGLAYEFLEGVTLTPETVRQPEIYTLIAKRMAQMHLLAPNHDEMSKDPVVWSKIEQFMKLMPKEFSDPDKQLQFTKLIKPYAVLEKEYQFLKETLSKTNSPVVFSHNDLLLGNVIYNRDENIVTFIDYEYSGYNYQAFDIANHFAEFPGLEFPDYSYFPEKHLQKTWLKVYLQTYNNTTKVPESEINQLYDEVNKFVLLPHFLWGCWGLIQSLHSYIDFDYLRYAAIRFDEYFRKKAELF
ncbi:hypothetical protein KPH14_007510 [Odynerus spinipes]|uniref:ethanolamine kinase n=1 Tax=Odynerus spinipes TaxID=1348599 RepID=A0AAD9RHF0_9HYME|nr:hypothetical protein KPH14_007510 [Odynerus spinipes]